MNLDPNPSDERSIVELAEPISRHWRLLIGWPLAAALIGLGVTFVIDPTYTARTTLLPPQKTQNTAAAAMQSLGAFAGLAGLGGAQQTTSDQFATMLQSANVEDRLIDKFGLMQLYDEKYRDDARRELEKRVHVDVGKKDGILTIEVDDIDPQRAAAMANQHVDELRRLNSTLAITEPQQRRLYFEQQLKETQKNLDAAQKSLQGSGLRRRGDQDRTEGCRGHLRQAPGRGHRRIGAAADDARHARRHRTRDAPAARAAAARCGGSSLSWKARAPRARARTMSASTANSSIRNHCWNSCHASTTWPGSTRRARRRSSRLSMSRPRRRFASNFPVDKVPRFAYFSTFFVFSFVLFRW